MCVCVYAVHPKTNMIACTGMCCCLKNPPPSTYPTPHLLRPISATTKTMVTGSIC